MTATQEDYQNEKRAPPGDAEWRKGAAGPAGGMVGWTPAPVVGNLCRMPEHRAAQSAHVETALAYLEAGFRGDNDACARLLGESYVAVDHSQGVVAQTIEELQQMAEEHAGWVDRVFDIERVMETVDGTVICLGVLTQTHMGTWRSIPPTGKRVTTACCEIVGFDAQGRVTSEEFYQDDLSILRQMEVVDLSGVT